MGKVDYRAPDIRIIQEETIWKEILLEDNVSFFGGLTYHPKDIRNGEGTLVLRSSNIFDGEIVNADDVYVDDSIVNVDNVKEGDIIVVVRNGSKALLGKHGIIKKESPKTVIGAFMTGVRCDSPDFYNALLSSPQFHKEIRKNLGATINQITNGNFKKMKFYIPSDKEERNSIGIFFRTLDDSIAFTSKELAKLKDIKKTFRYMLFPASGKTKPQLRFNGFSGDWSSAPLSDYLTIRNDICGSNYTINDVLSVSGDYGVVNQIAFQGRSFAGASIANYRVANVGNVIYTKSPLKANPYGIIKAVKKDEGVVSPLYAVYNTTEKADANFIQVFFDEVVSLNNYLRPLVNKGAKNTLLISDETAISGSVTFPDVEEQRAIANFFVAVDALIDANNRRLEKLRHLKAACLDGMFVNEK